MSRKELVEIARRGVAHFDAGTVDLADGVLEVPVTRYFDPDRGSLEVERVFKRLPLMLGSSSELAEPGAYLALEVVGVPVLITRGQEREIRAFVNMCSHRGAIVTEEGAGKKRRHVCPYHAWSYDSAGELVGVSDAEAFGEIDRSCLGLTRLPCEERAGLIWVTLTTEPVVDLDTFLCGYDAMLEHLGLANCHMVGRQSLRGPNWKIAYDGYLDYYHLPILHKETFGPGMSTKALYDAWGPHQRVSMPNPLYQKLDEKPEDEWDPAQLIAGVWTIFPHISIADFDAGGKLYMVSQLFPGATADESVTVQNFLATSEPDAERQKSIDGTMRFLLGVVRDEDYYTGNRI